MKKSIQYLIVFMVSFLATISLYAQQASQDYDFMKPFVATKEKLKKLPAKKIEGSLFCSQMNLMVDRAVPAEPSQAGLKADRIVVSKTRRKMYLFNHRELISEYPVAFGFGSLDGAKSQSADGRTPEGVYQIDKKKEDSNYHRALHISYPNAQDVAFAKANKVKPGGAIMVHGYPENEVDGLDPILIQQIHPRVDWTQGCIAVSNSEIEEIFSYVKEGATIEICPLEPEI